MDVIRHYDGELETAQKISAQSKRGKIWAVEWTYRQHRICLLRKDAEKARVNWVLWKERLGWKKIGRNFVNPETGKQENCAVTAYDPHTRSRLV